LRHFALIRNSSLACAALAGILFQPALVSAVALGNIALQSSLGQPLRVVIPVALSSGEVLNTSCLKLMRDPQPGTPQLLTGRVSVERNAASTRLIVTTPRAIEEPALRVSVQAGCGNTVRRDYVLLLDPQAIGSGTMVASADPDEFKHYVSAMRADAPAKRPQRVVVEPVAFTPEPVRLAAAPRTVVDPAPARTEFTPIALPAPIVAARTQKEAPPAAAPIASAPVAQREPVMLTAVQPQGGFIAEAAAASLPRVSADNQNPIASSMPTSLPTAPLGMPSAEASPEATLWTQTWPYVAVVVSILAIALTAFAKRRRIVVPTWGAQTVSNSKSPNLNSGAANTFAHFGAMTEPAPLVIRPAAMVMIEPTETDYDPSLDTLLETPEPSTDMIDEHVIRRTWATLANENAVDIGTDSILKAIAAAERDLHIGPPEPRQAAIDKALDDDLLREPKLKG
jgi:hypothetical protein